MGDDVLGALVEAVVKLDPDDQRRLLREAEGLLAERDRTRSAQGATSAAGANARFESEPCPRCGLVPTASEIFCSRCGNRVAF